MMDFVLEKSQLLLLAVEEQLAVTERRRSPGSRWSDCEV